MRMSPADFCMWLRGFSIGKHSITTEQWNTILRKLNDVDDASGQDFIPPHVPPYDPSCWWPRPIQPIPYTPDPLPGQPYRVTCDA